MVGDYVALLRAVNVGGRAVAMADVRAWLTGLGFGGVRTLLQSGNAVFDAPRSSSTQLEAVLEREAEKALGLRTEFFVRSAREWQKIIEGNPYRDEARDDPAHLLMLALKASPSTAAGKSLQAAIVGPEVVRLAGTHAYAVYPDGVARSKLTNALVERHLGTRVTARNWNTVLRIGALLSPTSSTSTA